MLLIEKCTYKSHALRRCQFNRLKKLCPIHLA